MSRFPFFVVAAGALFTATPASAQFFGGVGVRGYSLGQRYVNPLGGFGPSIPPPVYNFNYRGTWQYGVSVNGPGGPISIGYSRTFQYGYTAVGGFPPILRSAYTLPTYNGYITGSASSPADLASQKEFERAQKEAAWLRTRNPAAKTQIYDQWAYEKLGVTGLVGLEKMSDQPAALQKALAAEDEAEVASGEVLNHIMVAVVAQESKGAKGPSAFLPPQLLNDIRFGGSPAADALTLVRAAGKTDTPAAFDSEPLRKHAEAVEREFAALVAPVLQGKPADSAKVAKFEATLKAAADAVEPQVRTLPFEDAVAVRKYLNQRSAVVKVLKDPAAVGFVNPKWATEGANVSDLTRHMAKYKMLFAAAEKGNEEAYLALHRGLAGYLLAITKK